MPIYADVIVDINSAALDRVFTYELPETGEYSLGTRGSARSSITYSEYGSILSCITSSMGCWIIVSPLISGSCGFFAM